jgi:hypothetical protein
MPAGDTSRLTQMQLDTLLSKLKTIPRTHKEQLALMYALVIQRSITDLSARLERLQQDLKPLEDILTLEDKSEVLEALEGITLPKIPTAMEVSWGILKDIDKNPDLRESFNTIPPGLRNTLLGWVDNPSIIECLTFLAALEVAKNCDQTVHTAYLMVTLYTLSQQMEALR